MSAPRSVRFDRLDHHVPQASGREDYLKRKPLRAAVLREGEDGAEKCARVVPKGAKEKRLGKAVLGYEARPSRPRGRMTMNVRVRELERTISGRPGVIHDANGVVMCDAPNILEFAVHTVTGARRLYQQAVKRFQILSGQELDDDLRSHVRKWADRWLPDIDPDELSFEIECAVREVKTYTAAQAGTALHLTKEEKARHSIRTIRAAGVSKREQEEDKKKRKRERDRLRAAEQRRAAGISPRKRGADADDVAIMAKYGFPRSSFYRWKKVPGLLARKMAQIDAARGAQRAPASSKDGSDTSKSRPKEIRKLRSDFRVPKCEIREAEGWQLALVAAALAALSHPSFVAVGKAVAALRADSTGGEESRLRRGAA